MLWIFVKYLKNRWHFYLSFPPPTTSKIRPSTDLLIYYKVIPHNHLILWELFKNLIPFPRHLSPLVTSLLHLKFKKLHGFYQGNLCLALPTRTQVFLTFTAPQFFGTTCTPRSGIIYIFRNNLTCQMKPFFNILSSHTNQRTGLILGHLTIRVLLPTPTWTGNLKTLIGQEELFHIFTIPSKIFISKQLLAWWPAWKHSISSTLISSTLFKPCQQWNFFFSTWITDLVRKLFFILGRQMSKKCMIGSLKLISWGQ